MISTSEFIAALDALLLLFLTNALDSSLTFADLTENPRTTPRNTE